MAKEEVKVRSNRGKSDEEILRIIDGEIEALKAEAKVFRKRIRDAEKAREEAAEQAKVARIAELTKGKSLDEIEAILKNALGQI